MVGGLALVFIVAITFLLIRCHARFGEKLAQW